MTGFVCCGYLFFCLSLAVFLSSVYVESVLTGGRDVLILRHFAVFVSFHTSKHKLWLGRFIKQSWTQTKSSNSLFFIDSFIHDRVYLTSVPFSCYYQSLHPNCQQYLTSAAFSCYKHSLHLNFQQYLTIQYSIQLTIPFSCYNHSLHPNCQQHEALLKNY